MKKAIFVIVLMMAVLVEYGYSADFANNVNNANTTMQQEKPMRTTIMASELPKAVTDNIAKDYAGYTIKEATSVTTGSVVTFEVVVTKGTMSETLVYDNAGKFLKKLAPSKDK
jgi:hypothetical protein